MTGIIVRPNHIEAQKYRVAMPLATHWEAATCEDVDCPAFLNGWKTVLPADSDLVGVLRRSGRLFTEECEEAGMLTFVFPAGQPCFAASTHRQQSGRPGLYIHANRETNNSRVVQESEWQERFEETLDGLSAQIEGI